MPSSLGGRINTSFSTHPDAWDESFTRSLWHHDRFRMAGMYFVHEFALCCRRNASGRAGEDHSDWQAPPRRAKPRDMDQLPLS